MAITTVKQHRKFLNEISDLKSLKGSKNYKRRILKRAHGYQAGHCYWCGTETYLWWEVTTDQFKKLGPATQATAEHIFPKSAGGTRKDDNIACACYSCNSLRGTIPHDQFLWVAENPERLAKFKARRDLRAASNALHKAKAAHRRIVKEAEKQKERLDKEVQNAHDEIGRRQRAYDALHR